MENLISHLEQAVDEEESVKEVLLRLKHTDEIDKARSPGEKLLLSKLEDMLFLEEPFHCRYSLPASIISKALNVTGVHDCCRVLPLWPNSFDDSYVTVLNILEHRYKLDVCLLDKVKILKTEALSTPDKKAFKTAKVKEYVQHLRTEHMTLGSTDSPLGTTLTYLDSLGEYYFVRLAPLVESQRSIKHYVVPLTEPDIQTSFEAANIVPSIAFISEANSCSVDQGKHIKICDSTAKTPLKRKRSYGRC